MSREAWGAGHNIGALIIGIGFWGPLYYHYPKIVLIVFKAPFLGAFAGPRSRVLGSRLEGLGDKVYGVDNGLGFGVLRCLSLRGVFCLLRVFEAAEMRVVGFANLLAKRWCWRPAYFVGFLNITIL